MIKLMKQSLILVLISLFSVSTIQAKMRPLHTFLVGAVFVMTGGIFESKRASENDDAGYNKMKASEKLNAYNQDLVEGNNWNTKAIVEKEKWGETFEYQTYVASSKHYYDRASKELNQYNGFSNWYADSNSKANLYRTISLTSFAIGGVFIAKSIIDKLTEQNKLANQITKNINIEPTQEMNGAKVSYEYKYDNWIPWNSR